jgi:hypothetical protein
MQTVRVPQLNGHTALCFHMTWTMAVCGYMHHSLKPQLPQKSNHNPADNERKRATHRGCVLTSSLGVWDRALMCKNHTGPLPTPCKHIVTLPIQAGIDALLPPSAVHYSQAMQHDMPLKYAAPCRDKQCPSNSPRRQPGRGCCNGTAIQTNPILVHFKSIISRILHDTAGHMPLLCPLLECMPKECCHLFPSQLGDKSQTKNYCPSLTQQPLQGNQAHRHSDVPMPLPAVHETLQLDAASGRLQTF